MLIWNLSNSWFKFKRFKKVTSVKRLFGNSSHMHTVTWSDARGYKPSRHIIGTIHFILHALCLCAVSSFSCFASLCSNLASCTFFNLFCGRFIVMWLTDSSKMCWFEDGWGVNLRLYLSLYLQPQLPLQRATHALCFWDEIVRHWCLKNPVRCFISSLQRWGLWSCWIFLYVICKSFIHLFICWRLLQQLDANWSGAPLGTPETHIVNKCRYGTSELSSQSIFTLVETQQDQRCGIWSSCSWLTNSTASQSLHN